MSDRLSALEMLEFRAGEGYGASIDDVRTIIARLKEEQAEMDGRIAGLEKQLRVRRERDGAVMACAEFVVESGGVFAPRRSADSILADWPPKVPT